MSALTSSADLRDWRVETIVLRHIESPRHAFSYVDWLFDGDDIIAVSRTAWDGETNAQNANYVTFHRIADFRHRTLADSPEWLGMRKDKKTLQFDDFSIEGVRFSMEKLVDDAQAYANKPYVWKEIPPLYSGWTYTRITGGINNNFNSLLVVRAKRDAVLYMARCRRWEGSRCPVGSESTARRSISPTAFHTFERLPPQRRRRPGGCRDEHDLVQRIVLIPPKAP